MAQAAGTGWARTSAGLRGARSRRRSPGAVAPRPAALTCTRSERAGLRGLARVGYHTEAGSVGAVVPRTDKVLLGFEQGARLPDPEGLFEGTGRRVRYVHLVTSRPCSSPPFVISWISLSRGPVVSEAGDSELHSARMRQRLGSP